MATSLSEQDRRKLDDIVSRMEANGEAESDIRFVVDDFKQKYGGRASGELSAAPFQPIPLRPELDNPAQNVMRLFKDTVEGFAPPTSLEAAKRFLHPVPGAYGPQRSAQEVQTRGREYGSNAIENFVQLPFVRDYPKTAAALGTGAEVFNRMALPTPSDIPAAVVIPKAIKGAIAGEMGLRDLMSRGAKRVMSAFSPVSYEAINERFNNPDAVKNALTREQMGQSVVSSQNKLGQLIKDGDAAARGTLSGEQTLTKEQLSDALEMLKRKFTGDALDTAVSPAARGSVGTIESAKRGLRRINPLEDLPPIEIPAPDMVRPGPAGLPVREPLIEVVSPEQTGRFADTLSERQLKDLIGQYDEGGLPWGDPRRNAMKSVRTTYDRTLKSVNPEYKAAMKPVSDDAKLQAIINKKMSLKYDPTLGTYATDATAGKWQPSLLEGKKPETSFALRKLGERTGNDLMEKARLSNYRSQFEGTKTQGSRMVQLGRHVAGTPGAIAGALIDRAGGKATAAVIDTLNLIPTINSMPSAAQTALSRILGLSISHRRSRNGSK